jgi:uncharacterized repeat protein (TIGR03803 family)
MTVTQSLIRRLCLVLPVLALGFAAKVAFAQPDEADAGNVKFTVLHSFCSQSGCADGVNPAASVFQAANGDLYGTTDGGGANGSGTLFRVSPSGTLATLYSFCAQALCQDGAYPASALVQATNGDLYGTTPNSGPNCAPHGCGTVFKMTPSGELTTLHNFCSQASCPDGNNPIDGLVQAANGDLYGTTASGGASNFGTIFKITPGGTLTTIYSFCSQAACADGTTPFGTLLQASDGNLYGTTPFGGISNGICANGQCGTIFKITPSGKLTTLYSFCSQPGCADGSNPWVGLVQAAKGDLYGTTAFEGANSSVCSGACGTVFKVTPSGTLTTLYSFCSQAGCADGNNPQGALVQAASGNLYGTTARGGEDNCPGSGGCGTIFRSHRVAR